MMIVIDDDNDNCEMIMMTKQVRWGVANTRQFLQQLAALGRDVSACSERVGTTFIPFCCVKKM